MFLHQVKYGALRLLRNRSEIIWILLFPMILGTLFYAAFSNILNSHENFHEIPVAIVLSESEFSKSFQTAADVLGEEGDNQMLSILYTNKINAKRLLEKKEVCGIITADETVSLTVSMDMDSSTMEQSILDSFVKEFNANYSAIQEISITHPQKLNDVLPLLDENTSYLEERNLTDGNMNIMLQYYFNLIAMACLYTSIVGSSISINNQANLSAVGARKNALPVHRFTLLFAEFLSNLIVQFGCLCAVFAYLVLVLKIDPGPHIGLLLLSIFAGCTLGISMGIFVGSMGHMSEGTKMGILIGISMVFCFLSGLMDDSMRPTIENYCPFINKINPAALISDCFYSLNIYSTFERFTTNIITIFTIAILFLIGTFFHIRRDKYASL